MTVSVPTRGRSRSPTRLQQSSRRRPQSPPPRSRTPPSAHHRGHNTKPSRSRSPSPSYHSEYDNEDSYGTLVDLAGFPAPYQETTDYRRLLDIATPCLQLLGVRIDPDAPVVAHLGVYDPIDPALRALKEAGGIFDMDPDGWDTTTPETRRPPHTTIKSIKVYVIADLILGPRPSGFRWLLQGIVSTQCDTMELTQLLAIVIRLISSVGPDGHRYFSSREGEALVGAILRGGQETNVRTVVSASDITYHTPTGEVEEDTPLLEGEELLVDVPGPIGVSALDYNLAPWILLETVRSPKVSSKIVMDLLDAEIDRNLQAPYYGGRGPVVLLLVSIRGISQGVAERYNRRPSPRGGHHSSDSYDRKLLALLTERAWPLDALRIAMSMIVNVVMSATNTTPGRPPSEPLLSMEATRALANVYARAMGPICTNVQRHFNMGRRARADATQQQYAFPLVPLFYASDRPERIRGERHVFTTLDPAEELATRTNLLVAILKCPSLRPSREVLADALKGVKAVRSEVLHKRGDVDVSLRTIESAMELVLGGRNIRWRLGREDVGRHKPLVV